MSDITISIPFTKKYLVDYIYAKYSYGYNEPVIASETQDIGRLIKSLLVKTPANYKPLADKTNTVEFMLPYYKDLNVRVYNHISKNSTEVIEKYIKGLFNLELRDFLTNAVSSKLQIKNAIYMFCEQYNISPDDATYEALKKDYYRFRTKNVSQKLRTACTVFSIFV